MTSSSRGGNVANNARDQAQNTYVEFLVTQPPTFTEAGKPLEVDHWLHTIESKFRLLHYIENQKMMFVAQQLLGTAGAWWGNFTTAHHANHQGQWDEFRDAFRAQDIPADIMFAKQKEFMDLRQDRRFMYDYSKLFNHLAQYEPKQVEMDSKKKVSFRRGLSNKLRERLSLNTGGTFPEFLSSAIIADNAIHAHRGSKKKKVMIVLSDSAPHKYRMVCAPHHNPP
jgi:hypothetical protein